jgi:hypothetical protein
MNRNNSKQQIKARKHAERVLKAMDKPKKLIKFYIIEKYYGRYGENDISKTSVKADRIENVTLPESLVSCNFDEAAGESDVPLPVSEYIGFFSDGSDFTKVDRTEGYLELEESVVGIGTTKEKARAALQKAEANNQGGDDSDWD